MVSEFSPCCIRFHFFSQLQGEEVGEGIEGIHNDGRRLSLGGEHPIQCKDDMLWKCTLGTCIILLTSFTPINAVKRKKKDLLQM